MRKGYVRGSVTIRKIRTLYNHLQNLGLCGNPFKLRSHQGEVMRYVIDFNRLPETSTKQKFRPRRGRRATQIDGLNTECRHTAEEMKEISEYGNPALKSWRSQPPEALSGINKEALENIFARTALFFPPRAMRTITSRLLRT